jgi:hypothetical protein
MTSRDAAGAPAAAGVAAQVNPAPTDEEAVAIVAAMEVLWPKPLAEPAPSTSRDRSWRFSGRWWARPVAVRRDRPWR